MTKSNGMGIGAWIDVQERLSMSIQTPKSKAIKISLKQWRMFHAVIESDGFMEAAEKLHVSQSSISHALAKLQEQLGVSLLILKGRKAQITEEGKVLLERSRELLRDAVELEELAENLRLGWGPEIRMMIDPDFPAELLMRALREFSSSTRNVRLTVHESSAELACQALIDSKVDFTICAKVLPGYVSKELVGIEYVPVAHPANPLFALRRQLGADDLRSQREVTVSGCNDYMLAETGRPLPRSMRPWNVSSIEGAIDALVDNSGYAWLPKYKLDAWLEKDKLRILPLQGANSHTKCLYLISGSTVQGNSCAMQFGEALRSGGVASY